MVELVLEAYNLVLELNNFAFAVDKLSLLIFKIKGLGVYQLVEVVDASKLFRYVVLKSSSLSS